MTVKRRTIWLTDEEWGELCASARANGRNVSQEIRAICGRAPGERAATRPFTPVPKPSQRPRG